MTIALIDCSEKSFLELETSHVLTSYKREKYVLNLVKSNETDQYFPKFSEKPYRGVFRTQLTHLGWSLFPKIADGLKPLTIFAKKLHRRWSIGF